MPLKKSEILIANTLSFICVLCFLYFSVRILIDLCIGKIPYDESISNDNVFVFVRLLLFTSALILFFISLKILRYRIKKRQNIKSGMLFNFLDLFVLIIINPFFYFKLSLFLWICFNMIGFVIFISKSYRIYSYKSTGRSNVEIIKRD